MFKSWFDFILETMILLLRIYFIISYEIVNLDL